MPNPTIRRTLVHTVTAVAVVALAATGCGGEAGAGPSPSGSALQAAGSAGESAGGDGASDAGDGVAAGGDGTSAAGDGQGAQGTVTLVVDGTTSTFDSGTCHIEETTTVVLALHTHDLDVMLPPTPGPFTDKDVSNVILPPSADRGEYLPAFHAHGQWKQDGDRATGHVEGVAHLLSGIGGSEDPDIPYSLDFDCPVRDITGG